MNRRTLLAAVGSILAAGCSQNRGGGSGERGAYSEKFGMGRKADTPVDFGFDGNNQSFDFNYGDDPDFEFNSSQVGSEARFDFRGGQQRESDSLPTPAETNKQATEYLVQARRSLIEAIEIYAGFGGEDIDLTSVSPTTESFSPYEVKSKIDNSRQPLRRAAEYATEGQKVYIVALEQTGIFLKHAVEAEVEVRSALAEYQNAMSFLYDADTTNFEAPQKRLRDHATEAQDEVDLITSETDSSALQVVDSDAQELYKAKMAQFEAVIQTFRSLEGGVAEIGSGLSSLKEGAKVYNNREYENASFDLGSALNSFSGAKRAFQTARSNAVLQSATRPGLDFVTILYQITDDLNESAEAKTNDNNERYVEYRERAIDHLRSDDRTEYMSEINQIQW
ncbi:hypothetical protein [Halorientalis pallida]|uniref:Uncharacterized protein n=1 Tax=Halorientalis pallida TaxID=2479928 RepID=A0A498L3T6_9EURY|nr:hypothetical protein [Halorientalis pallida]RXK48685.1 hypothetical protein EAF64_13520 [Halorientalis pallida]